MRSSGRGSAHRVDPRRHRSRCPERVEIKPAPPGGQTRAAVCLAAILERGPGTRFGSRSSARLRLGFVGALAAGRGGATSGWIGVCPWPIRLWARGHRHGAPGQPTHPVYRARLKLTGDIRWDPRPSASVAAAARRPHAEPDTSPGTGHRRVPSRQNGANGLHGAKLSRDSRPSRDSPCQARPAIATKVRMGPQ